MSFFMLPLPTPLLQFSEKWIKWNCFQVASSLVLLLLLVVVACYNFCLITLNFFKWYLIKHFCSLKSHASIQSRSICLVLFALDIAADFPLINEIICVWCIARSLCGCACTTWPLKIIWIVWMRIGSVFYAYAFHFGTQWLTVARGSLQKSAPTKQ